MRCEQENTRFNRRGVVATPQAVRCTRKARVRAFIPYGGMFLERCFCEPCGERRAASVLAGRGKTVLTERLPGDPPQPRDSRGRFLPMPS